MNNQKGGRSGLHVAKHLKAKRADVRRIHIGQKRKIVQVAGRHSKMQAQHRMHTAPRGIERLNGVARLYPARNVPLHPCDGSRRVLLDSHGGLKTRRPVRQCEEEIEKGRELNKLRSSRRFSQRIGQ